MGLGAGIGGLTQASGLIRSAGQGEGPLYGTDSILQEMPGALLSWGPA